MRHFLKDNVTLFAIDVLILVLATVADVLMFRYFLNAVPNFDEILGLNVLVSAVFSSVAVFLMKTHRIIFSSAQFSVIVSIIACVAIKSTLYSITVRFLTPTLFNWLVLVGDLSFSFFLLAFFKSLMASFHKILERADGRDIAEERSVRCLNVAVFGTSSKSVSAVTRYEQSRSYNIVCFLTRDKSMGGKILMGKRVIFLPDNLSDFYIPDVEAVMFSSINDMQQEAQGLVQACNDKGLCLMTIPSVENSNYPGMEVSEIKHLLENKFIPDNMSGISRSFKRLIDLFFSTILIIVFLPLMAVIYFMIRVNDGKPVLFKQERIGRFGRPFNILKFRTMRTDAEAGGPALYAGDDDPRLTKVGKFLRSHHLDELPQLFNVFLGQMSFVGYRPERKVFIDKIVEKDPRYSYLYQIRPGVTSYATLKNGYTDTLDKMLMRLKYDLYYLNHRSLFFDLKVLWNTFLNIAVGKKF